MRGATCQAIRKQFALCTYAPITGAGWDGADDCRLRMFPPNAPVAGLCHFEQTQVMGISGRGRGGTPVANV